MPAQAFETYDGLPDAKLAVLVARGERDAIRWLTRRNNQRLFRVAWSILRNRAEAEDAVQDAYLHAFAAMATFNGNSSLSTWLTRIVLNEALMRKRASQRRACAFDPSSVLVLDEYREKLMAASVRRSSPEAELMRKQLTTLLETALARLPDAYRTVFVLREVECLSVEEASEVLQLRPETVKTRLSRARRRLQAALDPEIKTALKAAILFGGDSCDALTARVLRRVEQQQRDASPRGEDVRSGKRDRAHDFEEGD